MTVIADGKKRVTLPTKPGERFDLQALGEDQFILTRLAPVTVRPASVKLRKKGGFTVTGKLDHAINQGGIAGGTRRVSMTLLLDVNVLLAAIWDNHPLHERAFAGIEGKRIAVCPLVELGFIRISTHPKGEYQCADGQGTRVVETFY